jgi:Uma2 family endonuclease
MAIPEKRFTLEEYFALERSAESKSEYLGGEIFAMAGASREHNLVVAAVAAALYPQLRGCELYTNDMRVRVRATDLVTYPDVVIACGDLQFEDDHGDTLLTPTFLIEVLSPSTEDYDRGRKAAHYRTIPTLQGYLLLAQDRVRAELYLRAPGGRERWGEWHLTETEDPAAVLELPPIACHLSLADVYARMPVGWGSG